MSNQRRWWQTRSDRNGRQCSSCEWYQWFRAYIAMKLCFFLDQFEGQPCQPAYTVTKGGSMHLNADFVLLHIGDRSLCEQVHCWCPYQAVPETSGCGSDRLRRIHREGEDVDISATVRNGLAISRCMSSCTCHNELLHRTIQQRRSGSSAWSFALRVSDTIIILKASKWYRGSSYLLSYGSLYARLEVIVWQDESMTCRLPDKCNTCEGTRCTATHSKQAFLIVSSTATAWTTHFLY